MINYVLDKITNTYIPAQYPGESSEKWVLPDDIKNDFSKLNAVIETKYTREYLKICAFYNKLFPSLKSSSMWTRSTYNVPPFTATEQERSDTGTGISANYLKQIIDQVVARIGTVTFDPILLADIPTLEYVIYKDEVERMLRQIIRNEDLNHMVMEIFHDAAILGYSHAMINPVTHEWIKVNDYELGVYEAQFNKGHIRQMLYRDYAFPVTELVPYLKDEDEETKEKIIEQTSNKNTVDFKLYFDCPAQQYHIVLDGTALAPREYSFEEVQLVSFIWDVGLHKVTTTSLFDLLYPCQRELNKMCAKMQQLIRLYKGSVPVFNSDVDLAMKAISNGSGECLYVDSQRPIDTLMTVINPTPLDPVFSAEITARKTEMYELAGIQQVSFDMENMRSAAAVIALDQTRDTVFQAQLDGISKFTAKLFRTWVRYNVKTSAFESDNVSWADIERLLFNAAIELKPVHLNDPLGNKGTTEGQPQPDYAQIQVARFVINVLRGRKTYDDVSFLIDKQQVLMILAVMITQLDALQIDIPANGIDFMVKAFIDDVQFGKVLLIGQG